MALMKEWAINIFYSRRKFMSVPVKAILFLFYLFFFSVSPILNPSPYVIGAEVAKSRRQKGRNKSGHSSPSRRENKSSLQYGLFFIINFTLYYTVLGINYYLENCWLSESKTTATLPTHLTFNFLQYHGKYLLQRTHLKREWKISQFFIISHELCLFNLRME